MDELKAQAVEKVVSFRMIHDAATERDNGVTLWPYTVFSDDEVKDALLRQFPNEPETRPLWEQISKQNGNYQEGVVEYRIRMSSTHNPGLFIQGLKLLGHTLPATATIVMANANRTETWHLNKPDEKAVLWVAEMVFLATYAGKKA